MEEKFLFKNVTLLITHYNRSNSLERLLARFKELNCLFGGIVVSDDGSKAEHVNFLKQLQQKYSFELITTPINKGLGNNINKGQDAVKTAFTLYVQEDFVPADIFPEKFKTSVKILEEKPEIDIVRFYAYFKFPYLKPYKDGFSEMNFNFFSPGYKKYYYYSDHPHLRRSSFFEKFGRYAENTKPDRTEYRMMMSFLQKKGKGMYYENYQDLFSQENSSAEPSMVHRNAWRESGNILIFILREAYRHIRFNLDYLFSR